MSVLLTRRGTSCISSRNRRDKDRCAPLSRQLSPALELRLARARSDIASPFADAAGGARFRAPPQATAAVHLHALLRLRPQRPRSAEESEAARAVWPPAAARPAASECGRDSGSFRYRCAPSCIRKGRTLTSRYRRRNLFARSRGGRFPLSSGPATASG